MKKRRLYLENTPAEEALEKYMAALAGKLQLNYEEIPVVESLGRKTKEAVMAKYSSPMFNAAAMDGIAVIAERTYGASEVNPLILEENRDYIYVDTGDPINEPYNAVIMAEDLIEQGEGKLKILASVPRWNDIRPVGEDIVAGEMIIPGKHIIRAIDIGVLLSAGITEVKVIKQPEVAIFPTGSELIEAGEEPQEGSIVESNSRMFENMVTEQGGRARRFPILADDYEIIRAKVQAAVRDHDLVIINAGSSAGREDYTVHVLEELGEVIIHGVAIKPGKPVILAIVEGKPVVGLPGYPVSAYIAFKNFVSPILRLLAGQGAEETKRVKAVITKRLISSLKHREYIRVKVGDVAGKMVASPLARGAGAAMSLIRADGFCVIDQNSEGIEAGEEVEIELYRDIDQVKNTLMLVGSHDLILDLIADKMSNLTADTYLSSTHIGSLGGLMALRRGEAHMAPVHLLDEEEGLYNIPYVKRLFDEPMSVIKGVERIQGIMIKKGNPLNIKTLSDLRRVRFVNRQRGAGTRVLLDYLLRKKGIIPEEINGYAHEAATHMAVAAMVKSQSVDAGIGIYSAAKAMNLDFIPIGKEEYDFVIPNRFLDLAHVQIFISILKSRDFKDGLLELGGYGWLKAGEVIAVK